MVKNQMQEDLDEGYALLEEREMKLIQQEKLIENMGQQLQENEEFKAALAQQEIKQKMRDDFGVSSQMDDRSRSNSRSSMTDRSHFTALQSTKNKSHLHDSSSQFDMSGRSVSMMNASNVMVQSQHIADKVRRTMAPQRSATSVP